MTNFGAFQNPTDVGFRTFSILTDVSFGENEISTDVRFRDFFWGGGNREEGSKKKPTPKRIIMRSRKILQTPFILNTFDEGLQ